MLPMRTGRKRCRWQISMCSKPMVSEDHGSAEDDLTPAENAPVTRSPKRARLHSVEALMTPSDAHETTERQNEHQDGEGEPTIARDNVDERRTDNNIVDADSDLPSRQNSSEPMVSAQRSISDQSRLRAPERNEFINSSLILSQEQPLSVIDSIYNSPLGFSEASEHLSIQPPDSCEEDKTKKQREYERLAAFIYNAEVSSVSQRAIERLIKVSPLSSFFSYRTLISHAMQTAFIEKSYVKMCVNGHAARAGELNAAVVCPTCQSNLAESNRRFWFLKPSSVLKAFCRARESFKAMMSGCIRAKRSLGQDHSKLGEHDFYHGQMFIRNHAQRLQEWTPESDSLFIFITLSSDGFECAKNRKGDPISAWPVVSTVLNYSPEQRSKASNCIINAVIPSEHDPEFFESFLSVIVADLKQLQEGSPVLCYDGRVRKLQVFVVYFTADWPAASKVLGYVGHTGRIFCRFCLKQRVFFKECRCLCAVPEDRVHLMKSLTSRRTSVLGEVIEKECGRKRTASDVSSAWRSLRSKSTDENAKRHVVASTGIKRNSCLSNLCLDFVYSFPYDIMHLVLLGWTKHILKLLTGKHPRHAKLRRIPAYCIPTHILQKINRALDSSAHGIPSSWGRSPLSLENLSKFKAEDVKRHCELYLLPFFHRYGVSKSIMHLLNQTRHLVTLSFGYQCDETTVRNMSRVTEVCFAMFVKLFYGDRYSSYCLTPSTHTILHLPELLRECGPLPITSQFLVERLLGEIGKRVQQTSNISSHLFHKNFKLLALKLANEGKPFKDIGDDETEIPLTCNSGASLSTVLHSGAECHLKGTALRGLTSMQSRAVRKFVSQNFPESANSFRICSLKEFKSAIMKKESKPFKIESFQSHLARSSISSNQARQMYCIAAHFLPEVSSISMFSTDSKRRESVHLYYGTINKIFEVMMELGAMKISAVFVDVQWQFCLVEDHCLDLVFTDKIDRGELTTEHSSCIQRPIGFLDLDGRRYFIDPSRSRNGRTNDAEELLQGVQRRVS